jgi:hypothetical protein
MKKIFLGIMAAILFVPTAFAQTTTFHTDFASFEGAALDFVLTPLIQSNLSLNDGTFSILNSGTEIATFTPTSRPLNFNVGSGVPTAGTPIAGGRGPSFTFTLNPGVTAFGIDVLDLGDEGGNARTPVTFSATTSSGASFDFRTDFVAPNANIFFAGITSNEAISSVTFDNTSAEFVAFANLRTTVAAVPEPATWLMMIFGFAGVGLSLKRRRKIVSAA